ncbi:MAG: aspartate kinase [Ferroplasma sp.]|uniref:aspartate kinase n=1 Tax=Ferroplasma sp. TaxID=2591003 RepID=UPI002815F255|nr:aspartate kinase [Ferroplasma sp.]WMT51579.1 MAG: aspartate kinase [Ferroplasma sp.]
MERIARGNVETMVRDYIKKNPELIISMRMGILNVSKLSRRISMEEKGYNIISIRSALNKIFMENSAADTTHIDKLLSESKITLQDKIMVITVDKRIDSLNFLSATYLTDSIVYIVDETKNKKIDLPKSAVVERNVSSLHIFSSMEIVKTPGFVMKINERLFSYEINVLQLISCSNETIIIINRKDAIRAYEALMNQ